MDYMGYPFIDIIINLHKKINVLEELNLKTEWNLAAFVYRL